MSYISDLIKYSMTMRERGPQLPPYGWDKVATPTVINLDDKGRIISIYGPQRDVTTGRINTRVMLPHKDKGTIKPVPRFICGNAEYMLGVAIEEPTAGDANHAEPYISNDVSAKDYQNALEKFEIQKKLNLQVLITVDTKCANAARLFFENWNPEKASENDVVVAAAASKLLSGLLMLACEGEYICEDSAVAAAWDKAFDAKNSSLPKGIDAISGEFCNYAILHDNVSGLPGAKSTGACLVSYNDNTCLRGDNAWANARISMRNMSTYVSTLTYLIRERHNVVFLGKDALVYWTKNSTTEDDILAALLGGQSDQNRITEDDLREIVKKLAQGVSCELFQEKILPKDSYSLLFLRGHDSARISVSRYMKGTFEDLAPKFLAHSEYMKITEDGRTVPNFAIAKAMYKTDAGIEDRTGVRERVLDAILSEQNYPDDIYYRMLDRIGVEKIYAKAGERGGKRSVTLNTIARLQYIKAYLNKNYKKGLTVNLDKESKDVAYVLGRYLAEVQQLQYSAVGNIGKDVVDKYLVALSTHTQEAYAQLSADAMHYLSYLRTHNGPYKTYRTKLCGINSCLDNRLPITLSAAEQGMLIMGYYQECREIDAAIHAAAAKKAAAETDAENSEEKEEA